MYGTKTLKNSVKIAYSHSCIYNCKYIYEFHCLTTCLQKCQSAKTQFKYWRPRLTPSYLPAFTTPPPPPTLTWIVFLPSQSLHDYSTFPQNLSVTIPLDVTWLFLFFSLLSLTNSSPLAISLTVHPHLTHFLLFLWLLSLTIPHSLTSSHLCFCLLLISLTSFLGCSPSTHYSSSPIATSLPILPVPLIS